VSYAKCEDVKSISEQRLIARLGAVNDAATFQIGRALRFLLDI
jgi:mRNA-degrading endonuclease toxin of MazEF toxin-antitoxin module